MTIIIILRWFCHYSLVTIFKSQTQNLVKTNLLYIWKSTNYIHTNKVLNLLEGGIRIGNEYKVRASWLALL